MQRTVDQHLAYRILVDPANQLHVQLEQVGLEVGEQVEAGIAGAEVVDGGAKALLAIGAEDADQMIDIQYLLLLGDLEDDLVECQVAAFGRFQRGAYAGFRAIHRVGHEVDGNQGRYLQACRPFHSLYPAGLVEGIAIALVDLLQQAAC